MQVFGLDFTSAPSKSKPLTLAVCELDGSVLLLVGLRPLVGPRGLGFMPFEEWLESPGPWIAGIDFPFGQPADVIPQLGWPLTWEGYVAHLATIGKSGFERALRAFKASQVAGKKEMSRTTDDLAKSRSPMKLENPPVGKMFFEGATRLLRSKASILPVRPIADESRIIIEAYPAIVARSWIGSRQGYKNDNKKKCNDDMRFARCDIIHAIRGRAKNDCRQSVQERYGLVVEMTDHDAAQCVEDYSGDQLDSVLCAIQAAWAYTHRLEKFGVPYGVNTLEGWIVDPEMLALHSLK